MKKPRSLCTRLGAALLTVCLLLGLLPIASAASAAPRAPSLQTAEFSTSRRMAATPIPAAMPSRLPRWKRL